MEFWPTIFSRPPWHVCQRWGVPCGRHHDRHLLCLRLAAAARVGLHAVVVEERLEVRDLVEHAAVLGAEAHEGGTDAALTPLGEGSDGDAERVGRGPVPKVVGDAFQPGSCPNSNRMEKEAAIP